MGLIYTFAMSGQEQTLLWILAAVLIGEIATWAAPPRTRPRHHVLVAAIVTGTLILIPIFAFGPWATG